MFLATRLPTDEMESPPGRHLDQCHWIDELCLDAHGVCVGIRSNRTGVLDQILNRLPVGCVPISSGSVDCFYSFWLDASVLLYRESECLSESSTLEEALDQFEYDLELYVVERSPRWVFVHAGVVGWNGLALVIPGRSFSGKSTLTAALCQAGCEYYSDEYALFDREGRVHPYARPLRLRSSSGVSVAPVSDELLFRVGQAPLPVGLVMFTRYEPDAVWQPRLLSTGQALLCFLEHTMSARSSPETVLPVLRQVLTRAVCLEGMRGETGQIVASFFR